MQGDNAATSSASETERLRNLARLVAEAAYEDPEQLDELALLATTCSRAVREERRAAREARIARILGEIPIVPAGAYDALPDTILAAVDALLEMRAAEASRQQHGRQPTDIATPRSRRPHRRVAQRITHPLCSISSNCPI